LSKSGVVDPHWSIFGQCGSGSRALKTKNYKIYICTSGKNPVFFLPKIAIYFSLGLLEGRPSYSRSLQHTKENIQLFKT
jgi:hypothetical protein